MEFSKTDTGVGNLSLLQGILPTQELNPGLLHCRQILYQLSHKESPFGKSTLILSHFFFFLFRNVGGVWSLFHMSSKYLYHVAVPRLFRIKSNLLGGKLSFQYLSTKAHPFVSIHSVLLLSKNLIKGSHAKHVMNSYNSKNKNRDTPGNHVLLCTEELNGNFSKENIQRET